MLQMSATPPLIIADQDWELVQAARRHDLGAFERLVRRYEARVYRLAIHITGNGPDAEDIVQETFLKAYTRLEQFQGQSQFYTWLARIAVNEALMRLRKRRGHKEVPLDEEVDSGEAVAPRSIKDWRPNPEQQYAESELNAILRRSIASLSLKYRAVFQLRDIDELSTEETAELLGISTPAVKSRLLRARLQLREKLSRYFAIRRQRHP